MITEHQIEAASAETERLTRELDITNADHVALWLESNIANSGIGYVAVRIVEAATAVLTKDEAWAALRSLEQNPEEARSEIDARGATDAALTTPKSVDDRQGELKLETVSFSGDSDLGPVENLTLDPERDTLWANNEQMGKLFGRSHKTINEHLRNIFREGELDEASVVRKFQITAADGKKYSSITTTSM